MRTMDEKDAKTLYNDMLDNLEPLENVHCNPFSILLEEGDPIAYDCGFNDFCDSEDIEIE